jgi:hypothetical protein
MVSNLAATGIVPDFGGCYEDQMLRACEIENDLYAIHTVGERIAVGVEGATILKSAKSAARA